MIRVFLPSDDTPRHCNADLLGSSDGLYLAQHAHLRLCAGVRQRAGRRRSLLLGSGLPDPDVRHGDQLLKLL